MKWLLFALTLATILGCDQNNVTTNPHRDESDKGSLTKTYGWTNESAGAAATNTSGKGDARTNR